MDANEQSFYLFVNRVYRRGVMHGGLIAVITALAYLLFK
jgi:hypothetical protein